jgi:hypothetical protein
MLGFDYGNPRHLEMAALVAVAPTVAVLLLFAFGEAFGGDITGLQHLVQLLPLAILLAWAWRSPRVGGAALVALSLVLSLGYPLLAGGEHLSTIVLVELLLFAPPLLAGLLFLAAARASRERQRSASPA